MTLYRRSASSAAFVSAATFTPACRSSASASLFVSSRCAASSFTSTWCGRRRVVLVPSTSWENSRVGSSPSPSSSPSHPVLFMSVLQTLGDAIRDASADIAASVAVAAATTTTAITDSANSATTTSTAVQEAAKGLVDESVVSEVARDETVTSKLLFNLALGLLVYVTVGSIVLSIDKWRVNRNKLESQRWIRARIDGEPYESNMFLDLLDDPSPPADLPFEPYDAERDKGARRKAPPATAGGNREVRREAKRSSRAEEKMRAKAKARSDERQRKKEKKSEDESGNRAVRRSK